jgi:hypothetical protein
VRLSHLFGTIPGSFRAIVVVCSRCLLTLEPCF